MSIMLEGRVAGPWVAELNRVWAETAPLLSSKSLIIDLRNVTYADSAGTDTLHQIYARSRAKLIAGSPWTEYLARQISRTTSEGANEEVENANHA